MFALRALALLCWASLCRSAPLTCEQLVRPLDGLDLPRIHGQWVMVAAGLSDPAHEEHFRSRDSALIHFSNSGLSSDISFRRSFGFSEGCKFFHSNISLEGGGFALGTVNFTVTFVHTPHPDCLVAHFDNKSNQVHRLYLFCRGRQVEQKEMEEFEAQTKCFNLAPLVVMDPSKKLCPVEPPEEEETTEEQKA